MKNDKIIWSHDCQIIRPPISISWNSTSWSFPLLGKVEDRYVRRSEQKIKYLVNENNMFLSLDTWFIVQ